jgi:hypothetical protein
LAVQTSWAIAPLESMFDSVVGEKLKLFAQHKNAAAPTLSQLEIS